MAITTIIQLVTFLKIVKIHSFFTTILIGLCVADTLYKASIYVYIAALNSSFAA